MNSGQDMLKVFAAKSPRFIEWIDHGMLARLGQAQEKMAREIQTSNIPSLGASSVDHQDTKRDRQPFPTVDYPH